MHLSNGKRSKSKCLNVSTQNGYLCDIILLLCMFGIVFVSIYKCHMKPIYKYIWYSFRMFRDLYSNWNCLSTGIQISSINKYRSYMLFERIYCIENHHTIPESSPFYEIVNVDTYQYNKLFPAISFPDVY